MHPYLAYMMNKTLPKDTIESRRIIWRSKSFCRTTRQDVKEKHNRCITAMRHPLGRASHIKRHPHRSLRPSRQ
jgi:hypothetical protein